MLPITLSSRSDFDSFPLIWGVERRDLPRNNADKRPIWRCLSLSTLDSWPLCTLALILGQLYGPADWFSPVLNQLSCPHLSPVARRCCDIATGKVFPVAISQQFLATALWLHKRIHFHQTREVISSHGDGMNFWDSFCEAFLGCWDHAITDYIDYPAIHGWFIVLCVWYKLLPALLVLWASGEGWQKKYVHVSLLRYKRVA